MTETIKQSELRNNNAEIMRRVAEGESFTITVHGQAVADLMPHQRAGRKRRFVPAAELDALFAQSPNPDPELWERDMAALDAVLADDDLDADPWIPRTQR